MLCQDKWEYDAREHDSSNLAFVINPSWHQSSESGMCHHCARKLADFFNLVNNNLVQDVRQRSRHLEQYLQDLTLRLFALERDKDASKRHGETDSPTPEG